MKRKLAAIGVVILTVAGINVALAGPASAVGAGGWQCAQNFSFSGASSRRGVSTTSSPPQCGKAKIQVMYSVSGGGTQRTAWRSSASVASQPGVGYDVFQGNHHMSNPAWAFDIVRTT